MYIAEIAPARIRGSLVTLQQMAIVVGILLADLVSHLLVDIGTTLAVDVRLRRRASLPAVHRFVHGPGKPALVAQRGLYDRPGHPRPRGRPIARRNGDAGNRLSLTQESGSLGELFRPGLRVALVIGVVLAVLGQISGINTVIYYAPSIFLKAGFEEASSATWASVLVGITNTIFTVISLLVIDRVGRRALLMIGAEAWPCRWPWPACA